MPSYYLSAEASEARVRKLGPKLAEMYVEDLNSGRAQSVLFANPALRDLALAFAYDPDNVAGVRDLVVSRRSVRSKETGNR